MGHPFEAPPATAAAAATRAHVPLARVPAGGGGVITAMDVVPADEGGAHAATAQLSEQLHAAREEAAAFEKSLQQLLAVG